MKPYEQLINENEQLKQQVSQLNEQVSHLTAKINEKEMLYRNMITTFNTKIEANRKELEAAKLKAKEANRIQQLYKNKLEDYSRLRAECDTLIRHITHQIQCFVEADNQKQEQKPMTCIPIGEEKHNQQQEQKPIPSEADRIAADQIQLASSHYTERQKNFIAYIRYLIQQYRTQGTLTGISRIAISYRISSITKEDFFKYNLHQHEPTEEEILQIYNKAKIR